MGTKRWIGSNLRIARNPRKEIETRKGSGLGKGFISKPRCDGLKGVIPADQNHLNPETGYRTEISPGTGFSYRDETKIQKGSNPVTDLTLGTAN